MSALIVLSARLQSDSGNINHQGISIDNTQAAYVNFITRRGSLETAATAIGEDIRSAYKYVNLTTRESNILLGVLEQLTGSAELAEAYVELDSANIGAKTQAYVDSAGSTGDNGVKHISGIIDGIQIADGKVGGKVPIDEFKALRQSSIKHRDRNTDSMTLGRYTKGYDSYIKRAGKDSWYFDLGYDWGKIKTKYDLTDSEMFEYFNVPALEDAMVSGKIFRFSHNPLSNRKKFVFQEWVYIKKRLGLNDMNLIFEGGFWYVG